MLDFYKEKIWEKKRKKQQKQKQKQNRKTKTKTKTKQKNKNKNKKKQKSLPKNLVYLRKAMIDMVHQAKRQRLDAC